MKRLNRLLLYVLALPFFLVLNYTVAWGMVGWMVNELGQQRAALVLAFAFTLAPLSVKAAQYLLNQFERLVTYLERKVKRQQQEPDRDIQVDGKGQ